MKTPFSITRDINGNKRLRVSVPGHRAFSIQTNGNLPTTHRDGVCPATVDEVAGYVASYGTDSQKAAWRALQ
jgi:hypothetical protein